MRRRLRIGAAVAVAALAWAAVWLAARRGPAKAPATRADYVGTATCLGCHEEQASFAATAHHLSSALPSAASIRGSFHEDENVMRTTNRYLHYRMEARPDGFYQTAVLGEAPHATSITERIDLVIGSGRKGQSYLFWRGGERLFQLPISYWTELDRWVSSPGYHEGVPDFGRPVTPRCLECHATFVEPVRAGGAPNQYHRSTQVLGVSCEKCHGPGRQHLERQGSPVRKTLFGEAIVDPAELPRERQVDVCALCHGGIGKQKAPAFTFRPGEPLSSYVHQPPPPTAAPPDVHGNQVALLRRSACFQKSDMTCSTCHDVHQSQRTAAAFSGKCLSCHQVQSCQLFPERGASLASNCVDCHMPELPTSMIVASMDGRRVRPRIRTHWIRAYSAADTLDPVLTR